MKRLNICFKHCCTAIWLSLSFLILPISAKAEELPIAVSHCPSLDDIKRLPGTYQWITTQPGFSGGFASTGSGSSNKIESFVEARWVQLNSLTYSPGIVECEYIGDINNERIIFKQTGTNISYKPESLNWSGEDHATIPAVQRVCGGSPESCVFPIGTP